MKIVNKAKFKSRIMEVLIIISTIILTPKAIIYANSLREVKGYGGEYLIPVLGMLAIMVIESALEEREAKKHARKNRR